MSLSVYLAAPFADGGALRRDLLPRLSAIGVTCTSTWLEHASAGPEDFASFTAEELRCFAEQNDADLEDSAAVLVLAREGAGGEMFAEARLAILLEKPVVWVGRRTLSAWRSGVVRVDSVEAGLRVLGRMSVAHLDGARGRLLVMLGSEVA